MSDLHVYHAEGDEDDPGSTLVVAHTTEEAMSMGANFDSVELATGLVKDGEWWVVKPLPLPEGVTAPTVLHWSDPKWDRYYYDHHWGERDELGNITVCDRCDRGQYDSIPESKHCRECCYCVGCTINEGITDPDDVCDVCRDDVAAYLEREE